MFQPDVPALLRASGDIHFPLLSGIPPSCWCRTRLYWLGCHFGLAGIWIAYVADEGVRAP